jgi:hypothetical protein
MPGFWRKCRIAFRCLRFAVWAVALVALCALAWFNLVGLPDFLKTRLVAALREHDVPLEFSRMRLRFIHGFVAENVRLGETKNSDRPALTASEVQLRLNYLALFQGRFQVDGLVLRNGKFTLPVSPTNALVLLNLQSELRFQTNGTWSLDQFRADFAGAKITLSGEVARAPEIRNWPIFSGQKPGGHGAGRPLEKFSDTLRTLKFQGQPEFNMTLNGDARDVHSFTLRLNGRVPEVRTPWFSGHQVQLAANLTAPAEAPVELDESWGFWTNLQPFRLVWTVRAADVHSEKINADAAEVDGVWQAPELAMTKLSAQLGGGKMDATASLNITTRMVTFTNNSAFDPHAVAALLTPKAREQLAEISWTQPPQLRASGRFRLPPWTNGAADWRDDIEPTVQLAGELAFTNAVAAGVPLDSVRTHFSYGSLIWSLPDLELVQAGTKLKLSGEESEATKNFHCRVSGAFDAESVRPFLTTSNAVRGFGYLTFNEPLALDLDVRGNVHDFNRLVATGRVALTNFAIRRQTVDWLTTSVAYTNLIWSLPDLELVQAGTKLKLSGEESETTKNFHCRISGAFDAESVRPFLTTSNAVRGFGHLTFNEPLALDLDVRGNVYDFNRLVATGQVALTNCAIRGQTVDWLTTSVAYTNLTAEFFHPRLARAGGAQTFAAEKVTLDIAGEKLFITGGDGKVEPLAVGRAIGPKTAKAMEPYQFLSVPATRVNGCIPLKQKDDEVVTDDADLYVNIVGDVPFRWRKFETPRITGTVRWWKNYLIITNAVTECYGGSASGWGVFDVQTAGPGTDFKFFITGTNADFHRMGQALWSPTNSLEGAVSGWAEVTRANSDDWRTWNGFGAAKLRDGMLWDVPVIGLVSPALNLIVPGLGNSRATEAAGNFTMTNGVVFTDSLVIRSLMMRLEYVGTVDLDEKVNARVTAQLLRNTPLVGSLMSTLLWPVSKVFECRVTGTLGQPKPVPIYVPKLLLMPLHPIRSMEEMFTPAATNPPPSK